MTAALRRTALSTLLCCVTAWSAALAGGVPGKFDYYLLALSWSPTYCADSGRAERSPQCSGSRPYAFVLHGLWPQYERGYPETCPTGAKPWVPSPLISSMLDIMPARGLVIHQYRKHGTCSGLAPDTYFTLAREAFESIRIPARYLAPRKPVVVSPREVETDFLKTNPSLKPEMISITCGRNNRLREVRICLTKELEPRACGPNEDQGKLCRLDRIAMPPVRGR